MFADKLYEIIEYTANENSYTEIQDHFRAFIKPYDPDDYKPKDIKKDKSSGAKPKEKKKNKMEKMSKITLQTQGEIFLTDPNYTIFKVQDQWTCCIIYLINK